MSGYIIYHPKRNREIFDGTTVHYDNNEGNQDPYVWNRQFLHTYCHMTQMTPQEGQINFWVSGDTFPNFSQLFCDLVFVVERKEGSSIQLFSKLTVEDALWYRAYSAEQEGWVSGSVLNVDSETVDKVPDQLQTPALFITIPPQGAWCEESESTFICAYNFRYPTKIGYQQVAKNARAIAMGIQVKNTSSDDIYVNPNDFTIVLEDGRSYTYAPETYTYWDVSLQAITISPGDKVTGGLLFLVPNDVGIERIISRSTFGETVTIDLRKPPRP